MAGRGPLGWLSAPKNGSKSVVLVIGSRMKLEEGKLEQAFRVDEQLLVVAVDVPFSLTDVAVMAAKMQVPLLARDFPSKVSLSPLRCHLLKPLYHPSRGRAVVPRGIREGSFYLE